MLKFGDFLFGVVEGYVCVYKYKENVGCFINNLSSEEVKGLGVLFV